MLGWQTSKWKKKTRKKKKTNKKDPKLTPLLRTNVITFDHTPFHTGWQPWRGYAGIPRPATYHIPTGSTQRKRFRFSTTHLNAEINELQQKRLKLLDDRAKETWKEAQAAPQGLEHSTLDAARTAYSEAQTARAEIATDRADPRNNTIQTWDERQSSTLKKSSWTPDQTP